MAVTIANREVYSARGQTIIILLSALRDLHGAHTKSETTNYITTEAWFDVKLEDKKPYPSQSTNEPRWQTLIAWARKDCVECGLMERAERETSSL